MNNPQKFFPTASPTPHPSSHTFACVLFFPGGCSVVRALAGLVNPQINHQT